MLNLPPISQQVFYPYPQAIPVMPLQPGMDLMPRYVLRFDGHESNNLFPSKEVASASRAYSLV